MIDGVKIKSLETHTDERGFFREIIRTTDIFFAEGFGQLSHSLVHTGVVKAWHAHNFQTQWNYIVLGLLNVVLYDNRKESVTYGQSMEFYAGDNQSARVYCFPPGVLHGYKCLEGPMHIIYVTSGTYDHNDEVRISHDSLDFKYDWFKKQEIK